MEGRRRTVSWGVLLVVLGLFFLARNLGLLGPLRDALMIVVFGVAGAFFLYTALRNQEQWWAMIPGAALIGLAAVVGLDALAPRLGDLFGGLVFLLTLSLGFWLVFFRATSQWWAIIPGGVLASAAATVLVDELGIGIDSGGVMMLGMGCTFGLLYFVPLGEKRMGWALIPAAVLGSIGVLILAGSVGITRFIWPLLLLLAGSYLVLRSLSGREEKESEQVQPWIEE